MVNFFIGRPIFATVLALLMLLIGGICIFVLPIAQYPEITPPQVQVTTTYTGADAQTVAETVTTPIEQQINGVKGMIYFSSDSTSNGISHDRGDVRRRLLAGHRRGRHPEPRADRPGRASAGGQAVRRDDQEDVHRHGLRGQPGLARRHATTRRSSTTTRRSTSLDVLKRIPGVSDVSVFGRKYAMRIWLDPDRMATQLISPEEVIDAIQSENRQAAAGKIGSQPVPPGQAFGSTRSWPRDGSRPFKNSRRSSSAAATTARSSACATSPASSSTRRTTTPPAGSAASPPARSRSTSMPTPTPSTSSARSRERWTGSPGASRPDSSTASPTTRPGMSARTSTRSSTRLVEAFVLVLIVVFVFLQGLRATIIPMMAIPVALVATFAMMAAFGFSINTLTLCGLVLAIGLVVDDAIIVVENVEKYLERGEPPHATPCARPWPRSPRRSSRSPSCWRRSSCRWRSSPD